MNTPQNDLWKPLAFLIGRWKGRGGGEPGIGDYERTYQFIFNRKYIEARNKSTYPPTEQHPDGEIHEEVGYYSYDKARKCFVLRQFHKEGFVNQYKLDSLSEDGKQIVFLSEAIENIPAGWQAKETYQVISEDEFSETFELAAPNEDFQVYSTVTLRRY